MGILNVTPDSFSDGGDFVVAERAIDHAWQMVEAGAAIIDIGGESTRPGAAAGSVQEEIDRVVPVVEALAGTLPALLSVDTSRPEVMRAAVAAGAGMVNDVRALRLPGALEAAAELDVPVCLMHMQGLDPATMQQAPGYSDVVAEVAAFLESRVVACKAVGIPRQRLLLDPGFGFGKTLAHNLGLFRHLPDLRGLGLPLLVGVSRKSMIGQVLDGAPIDERLHGSVALAGLAAWLGASVVRVHDVRATVDAIRMVQAVKEAA